MYTVSIITLFLTFGGTISLFLCYSFFECILLLKKLAIEEHKDVDSGEANRIQGLQEPFIQHEKDAAACKDVESNTTVENGSIGMVLLLFVVLSHLELV